MSNLNAVPKFTVSDEELALLTAPMRQIQPKCVDSTFKYRNLYLLIVCFVIIIRNLFFPETLLESVTPAKSPSAFLHFYQARAFFGIIMLMFYFYSYLTDWYFERVCLLLTGMLLTAFMRDFAINFLLVEGPLSTMVILDVFALASILACFTLNALRDNRAPSMPRTLWS